jgi:hypothetical protein
VVHWPTLASFLQCAGKCIVVSCFLPSWLLTLAKEEETCKEDLYDECKGGCPDSEYPAPPVLEEQIPVDHPRQDDQEPPPEDVWLSPASGNSPCQFIQRQEELVCIMDIIHPEASNMSKRFHIYHHMTHQLHGPLRKGECRRLPSCFEHPWAEGIVPIWCI